MFSDNAAVTLEQLSHLVNGKPDGVTIKGSIDFGQAVFRGVNEDGIFRRVAWSIHFKHPVPCM